ncbi:MAG: hypothetical protein U9P44_04015, partial [archaeon]|nr:hypothetical protein [archaeon]
TVVIEGNVDGTVAYGMSGGVLKLNGKYESVNEHTGGEIYHKGKLMYKDGKDKYGDKVKKTGGRKRKFVKKSTKKDIMDVYLDSFERWSGKCLAASLHSLRKRYDLVGEYESLLSNQQEIQDFVFEVEKIYDRLPLSAGMFVSYCANEICPEGEIEIKVDKPWEGLGSYNVDKNWKIVGNTGDFLGCEMEGGEITVEGSVQDYLGREMKGGNIVVEGSANDYVGFAVEGGNIAVEGNAKDWTGKFMTDGEIVVKGNAGNETGLLMENGTILVKGDVKDKTGFRMRRGIITVEGNAGRKTGDNMEGGMVSLERKCRNFGKIKGGIINYKGKLKYQDGKKVKRWKIF